MPAFTVVGIDRETGAKGTLRVEAASQSEAMTLAVKKGLRVTGATLHQEPRHPPAEPNHDARTTGPAAVSEPTRTPVSPAEIRAAVARGACHGIIAAAVAGSCLYSAAMVFVSARAYDDAYTRGCLSLAAALLGGCALAIVFWCGRMPKRRMDSAPSSHP